MVIKTVRRVVGELLFLGLLLVGLVAFVTLQQLHPQQMKPQPIMFQPMAQPGAPHGPTYGHMLWLNLKQYAQQLAHLNLGTTERYRTSILGLVVHGAGYSVGLLLAGLALALLLGIAKGVYDAYRQQRPRFTLGPLLSAISQGLPDFWLVFVLQWLVILSVRALNWRPFLIYFDTGHPIKSLVLPLLVMVIIPLGVIARVVAGALGEIQGSDYIRTARAKGLPELKVQLKHALRPALVGLLDALPGVLSVMLSNLAVTEYLTGTPGLVGLLLKSIWDPQNGQPLPSDAMLTVAAGVLLALLFLLLHEVLRWLHGRLDPRLQQGDVSDPKSISGGEGTESAGEAQA